MEMRMDMKGKDALPHIIMRKDAAHCQLCVSIVSTPWAMYMYVCSFEGVRSGPMCSNVFYYTVPINPVLEKES